MTRYYTAEGTPPGAWLGAGLRSLAAGAGLREGSAVTPAQMERLFRDGLDPVTGAALGQSPHVYAKPGDGEPRRRPVAGFDATFSAPKSVSVLWALADTPTREVIYSCHRQAIADVLRVIERDVARTRIGTNGTAQVDTQGVLAAAFDHWDTRAHDPNLHTHVVLANRVQGPDGRWRTLDSRAIHKAAVAMSERYDALLGDHLSGRLGVDWEYRERGPGRNPSYDLAAVPKPLIQEFSRRSGAIDAKTDRLVTDYLAHHGHRPDPVTMLRLRQQANLATRDTKQERSLADLTSEWHSRARDTLGRDPSGWAAGILAVAAATSVDARMQRTAGESSPHVARPPSPGMPPGPAAGDPQRIVEDAAELVLAVVAKKRDTWTAWNVDAEASRALKAHRFPTAQARDEATAAVVAAVAARSVLLTPPAAAPTPAGLRRADGSSVFRAHRADRYTCQASLDAEARLLAGGRDTTAPTLGRPAPDAASHAASWTTELYPDQAAALTAIGESGRVVDVLVGPAGSGKTRTLAALRQAWEAEHGTGSVVGLAPSAAAAEVLAASLGIGCENTAKWLVEHDQEPERLTTVDRIRRALHANGNPATAATLTGHLHRLVAQVHAWRLRPGQLVILDEASLAGTADLDRVAACAGEAGAKLLLVGDWAQLSAIDAGGAFALLVRDRGPGVPELGAARRFTHQWERAASSRLRVGDAGVIAEYAAHDRLREGEHDGMVEAAYAAWATDTRNGRTSLLIAGDRATVRALNERARTDLVTDGRVHADGTGLHDGLVAGVGDRVVTRRNNRHLAVGSGWVKNGDTWIVTHRGEDGSLTVRRTGGGPAVVLPAEYAAAHVELGYATTAFRAQGATVDTAHAIVTGSGLTREVLYVMLTRAREANTAYVCSDLATEPLAGFLDDPLTGRTVLESVLGHVGAATSAHEVVHLETEVAASIRTLAAEYETIAHHAQADHWHQLLVGAGLTAEQVCAVEDSPAFGALSVALRRAEAHALPVAAALPRLTERADVHADDLAAVLHRRVDTWTASAVASGRARPATLLGGLIPPARTVTDPDTAAALSARETLIEQRADVVLDRASTAGSPWLTRLGPAPADPAGLADWTAVARSIAAYRDRYQVTDPLGPLGNRVPGDVQRDRTYATIAEALAALHRNPSAPMPSSVVPPRRRPPERSRSIAPSACHPSMRR